MVVRRREKRAERLQVMLTHQEVKAVEAWRFAHRMPSRSAAVRALMNLGLHSVDNPMDGRDMFANGASSRDFGVTDMPENRKRPVNGSPILIAGGDHLTKLALGNILESAGYHAAVNGSRSDGNLADKNGFKAVVITLSDDLSVAEEMAKQVRNSEVPIVLIEGENGSDPLPPSLAAYPRVPRETAANLIVDEIKALVGP